MLNYEEAVRFHGHNGPFLAMGYRIGQFANRRLMPKKIMDMSCVVKSPMRRPFTCVVDGIQCATNCTFGKGNVELKQIESGVDVVFRSGAGKELTMKIRSEILEYALNCRELEQGAHQLLKRSIADIIEFREHEFA